jgi:hypothetical protein
MLDAGYGEPLDLDGELAAAGSMLARRASRASAILDRRTKTRATGSAKVRA